MPIIKFLLDSVNRTIILPTDNTSAFTWSFSDIAQSVGSFGGRTPLKQQLNFIKSLKFNGCKLPMNSYVMVDLNDIKLDLQPIGKEIYFTGYGTGTLMGYHFGCTAKTQKNIIIIKPKSNGIIYFNPVLSRIFSITTQFYSGSMPYNLTPDYQQYILISGNPTLLQLSDPNDNILINTGELIFILTPITSLNDTINLELNSIYGYNCIRYNNNTLTLPYDSSSIIYTQLVNVYYNSKRLLMEFEAETDET